MGKGEGGSSFLGSTWMTIILVVLLIVLAVVLVWAIKSGWFYTVGRKKAKSPEADFQPGKVMNQQFYSPGEHYELASIDERLVLLS